MRAHSRISSSRLIASEDYLAGDAAGGFDPSDLMTEPKYDTAEIFGHQAEEALHQAGTYGDSLEPRCLAECPRCLVELDKNGNCPECGNNLCSVHHAHVNFVRRRRRRAPVRKIA